MKKVKRRKVWLPSEYLNEFIKALKSFKEVKDIDIMDGTFAGGCYTVVSFSFIDMPEEALYNKNFDYIFNHTETYLTPYKIAKNTFDIGTDIGGPIYAVNNHGEKYKYYMPGTMLKMYPDNIVKGVNHFNDMFSYSQGLSDIYDSYLESKGVY